MSESDDLSTLEGILEQFKNATTVDEKKGLIPQFMVEKEKINKNTDEKLSSLKTMVNDWNIDEKTLKQDVQKMLQEITNIRNKKVEEGVDNTAENKNAQPTSSVMFNAETKQISVSPLDDGDLPIIYRTATKGRREPTDDELKSLKTDCQGKTYDDCEIIAKKKFKPVTEGGKRRKKQRRTKKKSRKAKKAKKPKKKTKRSRK